MDSIMASQKIMPSHYGSNISGVPLRWAVDVRRLCARREENNFGQQLSFGRRNSIMLSKKVAKIFDKEHISCFHLQADTWLATYHRRSPRRGAEEMKRNLRDEGVPRV
jgi:hypothetical protein